MLDYFVLSLYEGVIFPFFVSGGHAQLFLFGKAKLPSRQRFQGCVGNGITVQDGVLCFRHDWSNFFPILPELFSGHCLLDIFALVLVKSCLEFTQVLILLKLVLNAPRRYLFCESLRGCLRFSRKNLT